LPHCERSFDDLVGGYEQRLWHGKAKRLGGPAVDDKFEYEGCFAVTRDGLVSTCFPGVN
jgi:hypothetical protein